MHAEAILMRVSTVEYIAHKDFFLNVVIHFGNKAIWHLTMATNEVVLWEGESGNKSDSGGVLLTAFFVITNCVCIYPHYLSSGLP